MRNAPAHVLRSQTTVVAAAIRQAFVQPDHASATRTWRHAACQLRPRWPKLGTLVDGAEADALACMAFPMRHRTRLHSTNPLERLSREIRRRADVVGILPSEEPITRLVGAVLPEASDDRQLQHRTMQVEGMAELDTPQMEEDSTLQITPAAA